MAPEMLRECAQWLSSNLLQGAIHELFEAVLTEDCKSRTLGTVIRRMSRRGFEISQSNGASARLLPMPADIKHT